MLDPKLLRNEPQQLAEVLARRGYQLDVVTVEKIRTTKETGTIRHPAIANRA